MFELFHRIADAACARTRRAIVEAGRKGEVAFRNVLDPDDPDAGLVAAGRRLPALREGERWYEGEEATRARLGLPPARRAFSVSVFGRRAGAVLLIHHHRLGAWLPVGGELVEGETPLEAARRELREETGLEAIFPALPGAVDGAPAGLLAYEEHRAGDKGLHLNFCFVADLAEGEVRPNGEYARWRWVRPGEALDAPANVVALVARALGGAP